MISPGPVDQADLVAGYQRASSIKAVKKEDLNKVYSEYGLKGGEVRGRSDVQLQQRAAKAVVDWWKKQQAAAATPAAKPATTSKPPSPATGTAKPKPPAAKPVTATGNAAASAAVRQGNANRMRVMETADTARLEKPKAPTPAEVAKMLTAAGIGGSRPPVYAMASATALQAWIARVKYNRALIAKKPTVAVSVAERTRASRPVARHYLES